MCSQELVSNAVNAKTIKAIDSALFVITLEVLNRVTCIFVRSSLFSCGKEIAVNLIEIRTNLQRTTTP
jgi:hypothetical protein